MLAIATLLVASAFGGGSAGALAQSIAETADRNVIIVTSEKATIPNFTYDTSSADAFAQSMRKGANLIMAPGAGPYFSDLGYLGEHFRALAPGLPQPPLTASNAPEDAIHNGEVTLSTGKGLPLSMEVLTRMKWSRPVRADYLMQDLAISASVKNMPEVAFLSGVAKAAGGSLTTDSKGFNIAYDAEQLRARVVATLKREATPSEPNLTDVKRAYYIAVIGLLPTDTLLGIFQNPSNTPMLSVEPNSDLASASVEYIRAYEAVRNTGTLNGQTRVARRRPGRGNQNSDILSRVDSRATVRLRLNASGTIILSVPVIQGRTSRYIDI